MKKILLIILVLSISIFFGACSFLEDRIYAFTDTDREFTDKTFAKLIDAVNNKDESELRNLFSVNTQNSAKNFEDSINYLINFFKEQTLEFEKTDGVGSKGHYEDGKKVIDLFTTYNVKSNEQKYYFAIEMTKVNTFDDNNGILCLYIINAKDWHEDHVYHGDNKIGIHIVSDY